MAESDAEGLSIEKLAFWKQHGFLILRGVLDHSECEEVKDLVSAEWASTAGNDHVVDIATGPNAHQWFRLHNAPANSRNEVYKLNNLFARRKRIRELALKAPLKSVLSDLLNGDPLICNSLNFERGSQQPYHLDTWYMPPPAEDQMVAVNLALEDADLANGPLTFYAGSHTIPYFKFSHGGTSFVADEVGACASYLDKEIRIRGIEPQLFTCQAGDAFIWHARLYHGGTPITDLARTRKSMVIHYWRSGDLPAEASRTDDAGSYLARTLRGEIDF